MCGKNPARRARQPCRLGEAKRTSCLFVHRSIETARIVGDHLSLLRPCGDAVAGDDELSAPGACGIVLRVRFPKGNPPVLSTKLHCRSSTLGTRENRRLRGVKDRLMAAMPPHNTFRPQAGIYLINPGNISVPHTYPVGFDFP